nr:HNH endonuclease [Moritella viscosa]SHN95912.1 Putative uncharacterized protein [Moritella viscosa]
MKLNVDLSALHKAIAPLGNVVTNFSIISHAAELENIGSHLTKGLILGEDIQLDEIDGSNGVLGYEGHQVMLYIPDQGVNISKVISNGRHNNAKRVHIAECKTIVKMREDGRFNDRYDVISRIDGLFPVFGHNGISKEEIKGDAKLSVCQNCISHLNYADLSELSWADKQQFIAKFSFIRFFESYSSYFKTLPESTIGYQSSGYTADWPSISSRIRSELNYSCEQCGVNLENLTKLLHVHHINGNKADNREQNLRALCADCHKKQPHHGHLYVSNEDTLRINFLRRKQNKFDVFDYETLSINVDSALDGLVKKCQKRSLVTGEVGIVLNIDDKYIPIDLCWPRRKVAVVIQNKNVDVLMKQGWNVFTAFDALKKFDQFQKVIR